MVRSLITALLLNLVMQVATSPVASAQIEMALDDVIVIDPALCGVTDFTPPEPIPTVCQKHAELGQTRGFLAIMVLGVLLLWRVRLRRTSEQNVSNRSKTNRQRLSS